jgi:formiminoglutamase
MSGESSSAAEWFSRLEPAVRPDYQTSRPDDPRLGEIVEFWDGDLAALKPGRAVLIGFPQDEGVRRNGGRPGTAEAPREIRRFLYRLTPWDALCQADLADGPPLDIGNVRIDGSMEHSQEVLGKIVGDILAAGAVPVVLGGGHETAFGHFLGYAQANLPVGIINIDAHLDLRPAINGLGHSGSPFRQAIENSPFRLFGSNYVCMGAQPHAVSREHWRYACRHGCAIYWGRSLWGRTGRCFEEEVQRLEKEGCRVYLSIDADSVRMEEVPGVSAPNALGLIGEEVMNCARIAGVSPAVGSFDLVEINPRFDRDGQSARWAALVIWHFLVGLAGRQRSWKAGVP